VPGHRDTWAVGAVVAKAVGVLVSEEVGLPSGWKILTATKRPAIEAIEAATAKISAIRAKLILRRGSVLIWITNYRDVESAYLVGHLHHIVFPLARQHRQDGNDNV
jgi:hypothetical protein